ncbi:unnamed protein product [Anisakis simplex]|uniref:Uncharacterized protein n=1 Tax=Anisakis simplex TaxID=6269 RepID=A0A0M3J471_ANISI|nr:unnamed protein product [Anisakis simplex]
MISLSKCNHRFRWLNSPNVYCLVAKCFSSDCTKCIHRYFASTSAVVGASDSNDTSENVTKANFNSSLAVKIQDRAQHQNANRWQSSALNRDSGKPFTRLRDRTGALRSNGREFDRDERLLMEKHRETLNTNELETIFDVVER